MCACMLWCFNTKLKHFHVSVVRHTWKELYLDNRTRVCDSVLRTYLPSYYLKLDGFVPQVTLITIISCNVQNSEVAQLAAEDYLSVLLCIVIGLS